MTQTSICNIPSKTRTKNIEFVFLILIGLILLTLVSLKVLSSISMHNFTKNYPDNDIGGEWGGLSGIVLTLLSLYSIVLFVWQYRLWRTFIKTSKRHYFQLTFIFIFGIFPYLNGFLHFYFTKIMDIKHPFTEDIFKGFLYIFLFPLTGGK